MPKMTRPAFSWALYDLANTIYSMNVVSLFFAQWVTVDRGREDIWVSVFYSGSMALVALTLPYLGLWSDRGRRKVFLGLYTAVCVVATAFLSLVTTWPGVAGLWVALSLFALSNYAFQGGLVFYNAMLPSVSTQATRGFVSGLGVALGYVGSFMGMLLVMPFVEGTVPFFNWEPGFIHPMGRSAAFLPTAVLFAFFALPLFLTVREAKHATGPRPRFSRGFKELVGVFRNTQRYPGVTPFLVANFIVLDAVHTAILFMAVFAQKAMGLSDSVKVLFFMLATIPAMFGSLLAGYLSDRFGPGRVLVYTAWAWTLCLLFTALNTSVNLFYVSGGVFGLLLGFLWTATRPALLGLTPAGEEGRLFGLYAFCNKSAAVMGPLIWGVTVLLAGGLGPARYRLAVGILGGLCALGAWLFTRVSYRERSRTL